MTERPVMSRGGRTAREAAEQTGLSPRTIRKYTSVPRAEWLKQKHDEREAIRAYHDDEGHTWPETAKHFNLDTSTVLKRARRARKERLAEKENEASQEQKGGQSIQPENE